MGKFYGNVGYVITEKAAKGVYTPTVTEKKCYGEVLSDFRRNETGDSINDDVTLNNKFSIIADPFSYNNYQSIRYIVYMGTAWKVTNVQVQYPRLILNVGGVYNGEQA